ncbi:MAG: aldehyde dehydrogenase family protein [Acidobacteriota bacterium]
MISTSRSIEVRNAFTGELVASVPDSTTFDVDRAISAAQAAASQDWPAHARYSVLMRAADLVERHAEEYARSIAREGSKAIREARREPIRSATILRLCAEEGRRLAGESLPFDSRVGSENRMGYYFRFPLGVIAAITPFNDPLALAAHKIGPALAGGNAVVLKPASLTPLSALRLAEHLKEAGLPAGRLTVVTGRGGAIGEALVSDRRVRMVTFTGGVETGEHITRIAGLKKLVMELGSNSPVIVNDDADLAAAVPAIAAGAFAQAGENCLGVQRVFVLAPVYERFREAFVAHVRVMKAGASIDEATDVCAMITEAQARRVEEWIREAEASGARVLTGGHRSGALVEPTVLEDVPRGVRMDCQEVYGPVVSLYRVASLDEAITRANEADYGLHAAIFTERLRDAFAAARRLDVGAVIVNDSTDYRLDVMPFGGTKSSGIGREGIRFSIMEMTQPRVVCLNL